jgi:hypothetical protein
MPARSEISLSDKNGASNEKVSSTITTRLIADTPFDCRAIELLRLRRPYFLS